MNPAILMDPAVEYKTQILRYVTISWTVVCFWEHIIWLTYEFRIWNDLFNYVKHAVHRHYARSTPRNASAGLFDRDEKTGAAWHFRRRSSIATLASSVDPSHNLALASQRAPPLGKLLVLLVRYTLLVCTALSFDLYLGRPRDCTRMFSALWAVFAACWAFGSAIFLLRVYVIWDKSRRVLAFFTLLWLAALGGWIYDVAQYKSYTVTAIPSPQPWCVPAPDTKFRAFCWGLCLCFDSAVLIATTIKLRREHGTEALWRLMFGSSSTSKGGSGLLRSLRGSSPRTTRAASFGGASDGARCDLESALASCPSVDPVVNTVTNRGTITKQYLLHSNLAYFWIAFAVNLSCFVVELTVSDPVLSHIPSPVAFALNPVVAVRSVLVAENYIRNQMDRAQQARSEDLVRTGVGSVIAAPVWDSCDPMDSLTASKCRYPSSPTLPGSPPAATVSGMLSRATPSSAAQSAYSGPKISPTVSFGGPIHESDEEGMQEQEFEDRR